MRSEAVNEQTIDQQTEQVSFEAASFAYEVSDEALEAAAGASKLGGPTQVSGPTCLGGGFRC
jgi:hypothetical protein